MRTGLINALMLFTLLTPALAAPVVTLGPPDPGSISTADPGSIRVEMLGAGQSVELPLSITIHPFCFQPVDVALEVTGSGGTFADLSGPQTNGCGGDTDEFTISLTGDGIAHVFDIVLIDVNANSPLHTISVELFPGEASVVTLGDPVLDGFSTVDPGSIRVDQLGAGDIVALTVSITVHPLCIRPFDISLGAMGDGGAFTDLTGMVTNNCGNDVSEFDITISGDGLAHQFEIGFFDMDAGTPMAVIPVALFPGPAPIVKLGSALAGEFSTIDPRSILVEMLGAGNFVDLQVAISIHPFCFQPIDVVLSTDGDEGTFADQTGVVSNGCGSDISVFNIRLNGDGQAHAFNIDFLNQITGTPLSPAISVEIYPGIGDTDSDGISDQVDNCTEVANTNQRDTDADAIGNACDPDIATQNDCRINFADLSTMADAFFSNPRTANWNADADFNGDGNVNFADLTIMQSAFFGIPGPSASGCN